MPGRPKLTALAKRIEDEGGDSVVLDRISDGESVAKIMKTYNLSRRMFYDWVHMDSEREKAWKAARRVGAEARVDEGRKILDDMAEPGKMPTNAEVSLANSRANWRKWEAGKADPETYGDDKAAVAVNLNIGDMHLQALIGGGLAVPEADASPEADAVVDAEILAIEDAPVAAEDEFDADPILADLMD
jgi:hypothetical protein